VRIEPQIHGGGHERGLRSGTLATHQIAGMGAACALMGEEMTSETSRILSLRNEFLALISDIDRVFVNGSLESRLAGNLNLAFGGVDGESLLMALKDLAVSSGSACMSASVEPSYVLRGIGVPDALAQASIRFSLGRYTSAGDVQFAASTLRTVLAKMRAGGD
jgi:cysteine desulfurase